MAAQGTEPRASEDRLLEEAAGWRLRIEAGEASETSPDYLEWLNASDEHADAMMRARITWALLGEHARAPELTRARSDALARTTEAAARRWTPITPPRGRRWGRPQSLLALAASLLFMLAAGLVATDRRAALTTPGTAAQVYATDIAETRVVTLPDNSRIALDAATRLAVAYTGEARDITLLEGQAFFTVARDAARPFRVTASGQTVTALGTAFNVELIDREVVVTLVEGEVVVTGAPAEGPPGPPQAEGETPAPSAPAEPQGGVRLVAGQQLIAAPDAPPQLAGAPDIEKSTAWRRGRIMLDDDTLQAALARVNRYSRIRIVIADPVLAEMRIGGVFNAGDTDAFIEAIETAFPIEARRMSASVIELHARDG